MRVGRCGVVRELMLLEIVSVRSSKAYIPRPLPQGIALHGNIGLQVRQVDFLMMQ
jgi:hypothetical protein